MAKTPKEQVQTSAKPAAKGRGNLSRAGSNWTEIDTTGMTPEQVAATAEQAIQAKKRPQRNKVSAPNQKLSENTAKHPTNVKSAPQEPEKPKLGRPSSFTQEMADLICERIADGMSLRRICESEEMPNKATVFRWLAADKGFSDQYARAREAQADTLFDDCLEIADDGRNDTYEDDEGRVKTDQDVIARSRLRVDTRKWMAGKLRPKVYGDKIDLNHGVQPENPLAALLAQVSGTALPVIKDAGEE